MQIEERLSTFLEKNPSVSEEVYIAPSATVVGDVRIGRDSSIWYGAILRGDINFISIVRLKIDLIIRNLNTTLHIKCASFALLVNIIKEYFKKV